MALSAHTHAYCYPFIKSGTKTGVRAIALCRKDRILLSKHKINNRKVDFLTTIIDVLCAMAIS